jgi:hypothetical protein
MRIGVLGWGLVVCSMYNYLVAAVAPTGYLNGGLRDLVSWEYSEDWVASDAAGGHAAGT